MTRREFAVSVQRSLLNIFEGCHKDSMKTSLSLRAILYENVTQVFENVTDFLDDNFLVAVLHFLYEEQPLIIAQAQAKAERTKKAPAAAKKQEERMATRRSEMSSVAGMLVMFDPDYMKEEQNVRALQDWNWINEEAITKLKLIAMGRLLAHGLFERVQGDTNRLVVAFC